MFSSLTALLAAAASATMVSASALSPRGASTGSMTPHDQYSSSIGVLGCKVNTNHIAYWPEAVSCDDICVKVSYGGRKVYLLRVDQSQGAHDISYAAWNWLAFGKHAAIDPQMGGGIDMQYETVHPSKCADILDDGKLPLTASNSMLYVASCLSQPNSWVAKNYRLYNIADPICKWGVDERCTLNLAVSNQPSCPSGLGASTASGLKVTNIAYGTGKVVVAL
ncbi:hypothetical protein EDB81DRAFT_921525 [Dactylonectria macrodidyma]|uniref:Cerato-platanin n=1 Tax=Dactylonectria macrodidyma TaxID=307937 RepID=A0A9P9IBF7_9HYPO|nr:hypothetical protein EDB81DRAFT_921525 [Dactylonectria macrodidyma]